MTGSNLSQILESDITKTCVKEAKPWQDLEDVEKHRSFTGLALINDIQLSVPTLSQQIFFLSSTCRWKGPITWKMFLCEYSCYPKPVLHLWGLMPYWNPSFKGGCWGAFCTATLPASTTAQLTGTTDYPNLTSSAWAVWRACCLLSCADQLILHCKDWKAEVSVITLGGSCVCSQKAAGRQNSGDNLCLSYLLMLLVGLSQVSSSAPVSEQWDFQILTSRPVPTSLNLTPSVHDFHCKWRQNWSLMPNWS